MCSDLWIQTNNFYMSISQNVFVLKTGMISHFSLSIYLLVWFKFDLYLWTMLFWSLTWVFYTAYFKICMFWSLKVYAKVLPQPVIFEWNKDTIKTQFRQERFKTVPTKVLSVNIIDINRRIHVLKKTLKNMFTLQKLKI